MFPYSLEYYPLQLEKYMIFFPPGRRYCSVDVQPEVANCTLEICQCEDIHLSDIRTRKLSGCLSFFFFLCYCFSLESGTNRCNLLLFLLSFQLSSIFFRSLDGIVEKNSMQFWSKAMRVSVHAQENKITIAVVNLIWQFLILEYLTLWP